MPSALFGEKTNSISGETKVLLHGSTNTFYAAVVNYVTASNESDYRTQQHYGKLFTLP